MCLCYNLSMKERCAQSSGQQYKFRLLNWEEMEQGSYLPQLGLSGSKRDLATEFGVVFAGMGVLRRRAGAMSTGIIILFAAVGVC